MYDKTITVFNRYVDSFGNITWYPTVLHGVNLLVDKAAIVAKYGAESQDKAVLNVRFESVNGNIVIDGKPYLPPKEWENQTNDLLPSTITFTDGKDFDFFILGDYGSTEPILDNNFRNGFYNEINRERDYVFAISSVGGPYSVIPHFEIMGA